MRSCGVHHVDLVVSSIERSLPFYRDLLGPLGWHGSARCRASAARRSGTSGAPAARSASAQAQTESDAPYDRYRVGLHHLALEAESRAGRQRAGRLAAGAGRRDRERPGGVLVPARLLRGVLLRSRRHEAGDRARPRPSGLTKGELACRRPLRSSPPDAPDDGDAEHPVRRSAADSGQRGVRVLRRARDLPRDPALRRRLEA